MAYIIKICLLILFFLIMPFILLIGISRVLDFTSISFYVVGTLGFFHGAWVRKDLSSNNEVDRLGAIGALVFSSVFIAVILYFSGESTIIAAVVGFVSYIMSSLASYFLTIYLDRKKPEFWLYLNKTD